MKFYTYDPAPNPQRVQMCLDYKGIELETIHIDMMTAEQLGEDYRRINPACTVPALVLDSGVLLTEIPSICTYLEDTFPQKPLFGGSAEERAIIVGWSHKLYITLFQPLADVLRNGNPHMKGRALPGPLDLEQIPELVERGKLRLAHAWPQIDNHLASSQFMAGDQFSFADIELMVVTGFANGMVRQPVPENCSNITAWRARADAALAQK